MAACEVAAAARAAVTRATRFAAGPARSRRPRAAHRIGAFPSRPVSGGPGPGTTEAEITDVSDRHKAQLIGLSNLGSPRDPDAVQGKDDPALTICADGACPWPAARSNMNARTGRSSGGGTREDIQLGSKVVPPVTISYPIDSCLS